MLSCAEFLTEFGEYLEDAADPQARARLEEHLHECKTCQVIMDTTRKTIRFVTDSESFTLSGCDMEPLVSQVMARIRTKQQEKTAEAATPSSQEIISYWEGVLPDAGTPHGDSTSVSLRIYQRLRQSEARQGFGGLDW